MKYMIQILIVALASSGLALIACDPPEDDVEPAEVEDDDEAEEEEEEEDEEEEVAEEEDFDEDMYVRAAFEMECVDQEIDDEDEAGEIQEEILARYGLAEESFEDAEEHFEDEESAELAIETRMENCDEDMARSFAEEGSGELEDEDDGDDEEAEDEDDGDDEAAAAPAPKPEPAMTGEVTADISGADFEDTTLRLEVRHDFDLRGELRGTKEGRDVLVPIRGEVSENGSITASGDRRGNSVELDGQLMSDRAEGNLTGNIHDRDFNLRYKAN